MAPDRPVLRQVLAPGRPRFGYHIHAGARTVSGGGHNVLLEVGERGRAESLACAGQLAGAGEPDRLHVVHVVTRRRPAEVHEFWRDVVGTTPAGVTVVDANRGSGPGSGPDPVSEDEDFLVRSVSHPSDLTGLGIQVTEAVQEVAARDRVPALCVDGLGPVASDVDGTSLYRFLHVLTTRVRSAGVHAHYHLADHTLDDQTLARVTPLFDDVARTDDDAGHGHGPGPDPTDGRGDAAS